MELELFDAVSRRDVGLAAAPRRIQAATESYTSRVHRRIMRQTGASAAAASLWTDLASYAMHPMTHYVMERQAEDYGVAEPFLYRGSLDNPEVLSGPTAETILAALGNSAETTQDIFVRFWWLMQVFGQCTMALSDASDRPAGVAVHLASPAAVKLGTSPISGRPAVGVAIDSVGPLRWFDITKYEDGTERCAASRIWRTAPLANSDHAYSSLEPLLPQYRLYTELMTSDVSAALSMAVNNGLIWFHADSSIEFGDGSFNGTEGGDAIDGDLLDPAVEGDVARSEREMAAYVQMVGKGVPDLQRRIAAGEGMNAELYMETIEAMYRNPLTPMRRMPLPVTGSKKPEYVPVGRAFSADTMDRQRRLDMEIARGLSVPPQWAMAFTESAPAQSDASTLRESGEYQDALSAAVKRLDMDLTKAFIRPIASALGVKGAETLKLGRRLRLSVNQERLRTNLKWAWENNLPVDPSYALRVLGLEEPQDSEVYRLAALRQNMKAMSAANGTRITAAIEPSSFASVARFDRPIAIEA